MGPEVITLGSLSISLIVRSFLSIYIAGVNGKIVRSIIDVSFKEFLKNISKLMMLAVPGSFINSFIEFLRKKLSLQIRGNMTNYFNSMYLDKSNFYKVKNIVRYPKLIPEFKMQIKY